MQNETSPPPSGIPPSHPYSAPPGYGAPPQPYGPPPGSPNRLLVALLLLVVALLLWRSWPIFRSGINPQAEARAVTARGDLAEDEKSTIELFRQASPSVVHITTTEMQRRGPFSLNAQEIPRGSGSGFLWDKEGHVVTNFHVIAGASAAQVILSDHSSWPARVVGAYPDKDLAVLVINAPQDRLVPIPIGTSADLKVGQKVFAIGNPFGLDQTLTTGVISALGRQIMSMTERPIHDVIQIDAAINPGNSGGPLLDSAGRLIGVNTAILSPSGVYAGIGFAIPVDEVNQTVPELIRHGRVIRPGLGVQLVPDALARKLDVQGVLIGGVQSGSPAEKAGLQPTRQRDDMSIDLGDIVKAVDGKPVRTASEMQDAIGRHKIGDKVPLTIDRDGEERTVAVELGNLGL